MQRFNIVHGDQTSTGGMASATQSIASYMGKNLVMVGDPVSCPKCKSTGYIAPDGPRLQRSFMGKQPALNNDLCMCKCEQKPRLINSLSLMGETIEGEEVIRQGYGSWIGRDESEANQPPQQFNDKFVLRDQSGQPIPNAAYALERGAGEFEYGETDGGGHTHLLSSVAAAEDVKTYLAG